MFSFEYNLTTKEFTTTYPDKSTNTIKANYRPHNTNEGWYIEKENGGIFATLDITKVTFKR